jgi:hypothetical protein
MVLCPPKVIRQRSVSFVELGPVAPTDQWAICGAFRFRKDDRPWCRFGGKDRRYLVSDGGTRPFGVVGLSPEGHCLSSMWIRSCRLLSCGIHNMTCSRALRGKARPVARKRRSLRMRGRNLVQRTRCKVIPNEDGMPFFSKFLVVDHLKLPRLALHLLSIRAMFKMDYDRTGSQNNLHSMEPCRHGQIRVLAIRWRETIVKAPNFPPE